jgi:hypothetical protein
MRVKALATTIASVHVKKIRYECNHLLQEITTANLTTRDESRRSRAVRLHQTLLIQRRYCALRSILANLPDPQALYDIDVDAVLYEADNSDEDQHPSTLYSNLTGLGSEMM